MVYTGIFAVCITLLSWPRQLEKLGWLSIPAALSIFASGVIAMIIAGIHPIEGRTWELAKSTSFTNAFSAVTNPVFAYAGHFLFFMLIVSKTSC